MKEVRFHVGYDPGASKARILEAIQDAAAGSVESQFHFTFESCETRSRFGPESLSALLATLTEPDEELPPIADPPPDPIKF